MNFGYLSTQNFCHEKNNFCIRRIDLFNCSPCTKLLLSTSSIVIAVSIVSIDSILDSMNFNIPFNIVASSELDRM